MLNKKHNHKLFYFKSNQPLGLIPRDIDEAVDVLINHNDRTRDEIKALMKTTAELCTTVNKLNAELAAIHNHYRQELCGTCCHFNVCGIAQTIKYGDECENHAVPCEIGITLIDFNPKLESPPATANSKES